MRASGTIDPAPPPSTDTAPWLRWRDGQLEVALHVQPGARRSRVLGTHGDRLKVSVSAPPVDGRANDEVIELLAQLLGVGPRSLALVSGATLRDKRIAVLARIAVRDVVVRLAPV